ncbi:NAD-dependent succinate-semialdehyde dehydrogenase [Agrobacterium sp. AGB01]|uniref:NAD-dependent succinate-semialdehyde dehydrogenase n=1 Tax=Agrobacterium sp. AGB01 TaxID=2769302 RepID=UPI001785F7F0|nr:NAD-dependent succinate-semialdehyde dehydrogenase [Agrobacterium sp. AGB01]MBD9388488.1 NAD-dependent succinate-semialdehyde dehydrogenase [Agrobacterium sp. AGB01]
MVVHDSLLARLHDKTLVVEAAKVGTRWVYNATDGQRFDVHNPSTGVILASLPALSAGDARKAIADAKKAQLSWVKKTGKDRAAHLMRWHRLWIDNADDLATILTAEQGKPFTEARGEILYGAAYLEWFAEEAKRIYGDVIPAHVENARILVLKQAIGVVAAITPWNFPNAMIARKVAPALAVGCAMVAKPAAETPLSTLALAVLADRAGIPDGLFSVITARSGAEFGREVTSNPDVSKITFTGSTEVGRILMRQGAEQIKKLGLELGGNAPFIVFDDADLDSAVEGAILAKFRNAGQTCVCANRIYVQSSIHDAFVAKFVTRVRNLKVGDGFEPDTVIGPLINRSSVAKVQDHIEDAIKQGAVLLTGGSPDGGTHFVEPTVIIGACASMKVATEETFGPLAPIFRFDDVDEVIELANSSEFGLSGYFYAKDMARIFKVAEALEVGIVGVNTGLISTEVAPFGGVKQSGLGREGSRYGADDYLEIKYICLGGQSA